MTEILKDLNEEQRRAVECSDGPVLIVAGAGSGKTRVLTSRIAYLIARGVPPERILALTFTKKAAGEMKERIGLMVGERQAKRLWMGTFHSVFVRFLREFAPLLGFPQTFTIYDTTDSVSAIKTCIRQLSLDEKIYKPKEVLSRISRAKNDLITPTPYMNGAGGYRENDTRQKKGEIYRIFALYCQMCKNSGVMDFDDILLYTNILLRDNPQALESIAGRFSHILVDEYQDTNAAQYIILKRLSSTHRNLCVVGDDSQSIYGFRGAQIANILNFQKDFPEARIFRLERNYRSTQTIVDAANALIAHNQGRIPKNCISTGEKGEKIHLVRNFTEQEEAFTIASAIQDRLRSSHCSYRDFAILYRTNSQSRALEEQLRRRNIPYMVYSGNTFFERAEVKDMMAYFKLAVNPNDDESFRRVVNKPARGIGDTSMHSLQAAALSEGVSLSRAAFLPNLEDFGLKSAAIGKIRAFCQMMQGAMDKAQLADAYDLAVELANDSGLYQYYKSDTSVEGQSRMANVQELLDSVKGFVEEAEGEVTLGDYLEDISLLSNADTADDDENGSNKVALMTIHSSKGLEFPYVFVAGMEENLFPSVGWLADVKEMEEERRLFYVAITRAMKTVTLTFASTRMRNGKHESNSPSRFLRELAPQYLDRPLTNVDMEQDYSAESPFRFASRKWTAPVQRPAAPVSSSKPVSNIPVKPALVDPDFKPEAMTSFKAGDRIEHNRFGAGEILEISGQVPDLKAKVSFDKYGVKLLLLKFAKLRHLLPLIIICFLITSCGVVRPRNAPYYHAGPAEKAGYEHQGILEEHHYPSSEPGLTTRRMIVYLPADYYKDTTVRYPVFYLLHGARGYETSWIKKGRVLEITDSLRANNLVIPSIIVMPNTNQYNDDNDYDDGRYKDAFESIFEVDGKVERAFLHDVVEYVDSVYRTVPESTHRAISGLSIGGHQSLHLAAFYPYTFSYIGAYSPYWWSLGKLKHRRLFYRDFKELLATQFKINPPIRYYLMTGDVDIVRPSTAKFCRYLDKKGYEYEYVILPGGHDWPCWKANLILMMENAFKGKETNEN